MGFSNFKKKNEEAGRKSASSFLKINKYENPQMALELIAHICTQKKAFDLTKYFEKYFDDVDALESKLNEVSEEVSEERKQMLSRLYNAGWYMQDKVAEESSFIKIAVAGGYSAGKSSFLNSVTGIGNVLPTGIEPVSMVNTYVNCSSQFNALTVHGVNLKDEEVLLDKEVLACIQHSSKSKVYIASVLKKLYIDVPVKGSAFAGITFIDTPGYNNSQNVNEENQKRDEDTAKEAFKEADIVFWCIDIEAGTITNKDFEMLKLADDKHLVIIFTKMDKKPVKEINSILKKAQDDCRKHLKVTPFVVGFSSLDGNGKWSCGTSEIKKRIDGFKLQNKHSNLLERCTSTINDEFETSLTYIKDLIASEEENRQEIVDEKEGCSKSVSSTKEAVDGQNGVLEDILINHYDEMCDAYNSLCNEYNEIFDLLNGSLDRESEWADKVGLFNDASELSRQYDNAVRQWNRIIHADVKEFPATYKLEDRKSLLKEFTEANELYNSQAEFNEQETLDAYKDVLENLQILRKQTKILKEYKSKLIADMNDAYHNSKTIIKAYRDSLQKLKTEKPVDVFAAIASDDMNLFLGCFSNGVELSECNANGYNPLTYSVMLGNNAMVKFFVDNAPECLGLRDKRGYNTLETAAFMHYKDICEMLIHADKQLLIESRPLDELACNDRFINWVKQL